MGDPDNKSTANQLTEHDFRPRYQKTKERGWVAATRRNGRTVCSNLYTVWINIGRRCKGQYLHRGISKCNEWDLYENFRAWALSNGYKPGLSLDRIDNDGDYEPSNCRWTTAEIQAQNRSSNTVNPEIVREIRSSDKPPRYFKEKYGLCRAHVWDIRTFRIWRNVK